MSKYEILHLNECEMNKYFEGSDCSKCEMYSLSKIENEFEGVPIPYTENNSAFIGESLGIVRDLLWRYHLVKGSMGTYLRDVSSKDDLQDILLLSSLNLTHLKKKPKQAWIFQKAFKK